MKIVISIALRWQNGEIRRIWAKREKYGGFGQISRIRWVLPFYGGPKNPGGGEWVEKMEEHVLIQNYIFKLGSIKIKLDNYIFFCIEVANL